MTEREYRPFCPCDSEREGGGGLKLGRVPCHTDTLLHSYRLKMSGRNEPRTHVFFTEQENHLERLENRIR